MVTQVKRKTSPFVAIRRSDALAPRERVFKSLMDPEFLNRWGAKAALVEPRAGGRYGYGWTYTHEGREVVSGPTRILYPFGWGHFLEKLKTLVEARP